MNELNKAKINYRQRTGVKRVLVKPIILQGTNIKSKNMFLINGKRMILIKGSSPDFIERV